MKKYIYYILLIFIWFCSCNIFAQSNNSIAKNNLYAELGGNTVIGSLNYERLVNEKFFLKVGIGMPLGGILVPSETGILLPLHIGYINRLNNSSLIDAGIGTVTNLGKDFKTGVSGFLSYRYQPLGSGFLFRISFTPFFSFNHFITPWIGISLGFSF